MKLLGDGGESCAFVGDSFVRFVTSFGATGEWIFLSPVPQALLCLDAIRVEFWFALLRGSSSEWSALLLAVADFAFGLLASNLDVSSSDAFPPSILATRWPMFDHRHQMCSGWSLGALILAALPSSGAFRRVDGWTFLSHWRQLLQLDGGKQEEDCRDLDVAVISFSLRVLIVKGAMYLMYSALI